MRAGTALALVLCLAGCAPAPEWTDAERALIASLSLSRLAPPPRDPSNRHADDARAAAFGEKLFADKRLSRNGQLSCAHCHRPDKSFTDGLPLARGLGTLKRHTPSVLAAGWSPWQFWDGRADSLWAQALGPLGHRDELGLSHADLKRIVLAHHRAEYTALFGAPADAQTVAIDIGKALAAYERRLRPAPTRFDAYADTFGADVLSDSERRGLKLFLGRGQCARCHFGPLLTGHGFHNTGLASAPDRGRADGAHAVQASDHNCRGRYSDDAQRRCPHLDYLRLDAPEWLGAFKTPTLRQVGATAPYMHDGRFAALREVLDHYNRAPPLPMHEGHSELFPLGLSEAQLADLEAFLRAL